MCSATNTGLMISPAIPEMGTIAATADSGDLTFEVGNGVTTRGCDRTANRDDLPHHDYEPKDVAQNADRCDVAERP